MPEKQLDKALALMMIVISFLAALADVLDDESYKPTNWKHFFIQLVVGTISGLIFGFFACWIFGENVYAVAAISGAGSITGIKGVRTVALTVQKYIITKFK